MEDKIVAYVDKTIVKITGIQIQGIKPIELEKAVAAKIGCPVRVIGVTSTSLKMDVYGLDPESILRDEQGLLQTISLIPGLTASDVTQIATAEKAKEISAEELAKRTRTCCPKENWVGL
ncbi:MAG: uncharacterized protein H6Q65_1105 [Firmicutes bacterium]|nr:uncharacterized protein [Bacillota bacterium]